MWLTSHDFRSLRNSLLIKLVPLSVIRVAGGKDRFDCFDEGIATKVRELA